MLEGFLVHKFMKLNAQNFTKAFDGDTIFILLFGPLFVGPISYDFMDDFPPIRNSSRDLPDSES